MISAFELKNRSCCRCFYKIPYFMKNLFLLICLFFISLVSYIINLSPHNVVTILTVQKIIAGLNSHTFNYLETNKGQLQITPHLKNLTVARVT